MRKTFSVIALLLSLLTVLSFSAFSVSAADSSEEVSAVESSEAASEEESSATEGSDASSEESEKEESKEESKKEESKEESEGSKEESKKPEASDKNDKNDKKQPEEDEFPWELVIFLGALVVFAVVCFICIKRENKFGNWLKKFFKDYKSELKKIVWASKDFTVKSTIVVIVCLLVCAGVIGLLDVGLNALILWLI
ncbi:MAG: preprotein translocase subunit SecE [Clostridia bacterium]|nr:preprotein translocase subunit SecE [Clostridia bacterium]